MENQWDEILQNLKGIFFTLMIILSVIICFSILTDCNMILSTIKAYIISSNDKTNIFSSILIITHEQYYFDFIKDLTISSNGHLIEITSKDLNSTQFMLNTILFIHQLTPYYVYQNMQFSIELGKYLLQSFKMLININTGIQFGETIIHIDNIEMKFITYYISLKSLILTTLVLFLSVMISLWLKYKNLSNNIIHNKIFKMIKILTNINIFLCNLLTISFILLNVKAYMAIYYVLIIVVIIQLILFLFYISIHPNSIKYIYYEFFLFLSINFNFKDTIIRNKFFRKLLCTLKYAKRLFIPESNKYKIVAIVVYFILIVLISLLKQYIVCFVSLYIVGLIVLILYLLAGFNLFILIGINRRFVMFMFIFVGIVLLLYFLVITFLSFRIVVENIPLYSMIVLGSTLFQLIVLINPRKSLDRFLRSFENYNMIFAYTNLVILYTIFIMYYFVLDIKNSNISNPNTLIELWVPIIGVFSLFIVISLFWKYIFGKTKITEKIGIDSIIMSGISVWFIIISYYLEKSVLVSYKSFSGTLLMIDMLFVMLYLGLIGLNVSQLLSINKDLSQK